MTKLTNIQSAFQNMKMVWLSPDQRTRTQHLRLFLFESQRFADFVTRNCSWIWLLQDGNYCIYVKEYCFELINIPMSREIWFMNMKRSRSVCILHHPNIRQILPNLIKFSINPITAGRLQLNLDLSLQRFQNGSQGSWNITIPHLMMNSCIWISGNLDLSLERFQNGRGQGSWNLTIPHLMMEGCKLICADLCWSGGVPSRQFKSLQIFQNGNLTIPHLTWWWKVVNWFVLIGWCAKSQQDNEPLKCFWSLGANFHFDRIALQLLLICTISQYLTWWWGVVNWFVLIGWCAKSQQEMRQIASETTSCLSASEVYEQIATQDIIAAVGSFYKIMHQNCTCMTSGMD